MCKEISASNIPKRWTILERMLEKPTLKKVLCFSDVTMYWNSVVDYWEMQMQMQMIFIEWGKSAPYITYWLANTYALSIPTFPINIMPIQYKH